MPYPTCIGTFRMVYLQWQNRCLKLRASLLQRCYEELAGSSKKGWNLPQEVRNKQIAITSVLYLFMRLS